MKRTSLTRKKPLVRRTSLAARSASPKASRGGSPSRKKTGLRAPPAPRELEPGEAEWKGPHFGECAACGTKGRLVLHHVVAKQEIKRRASSEQLADGIVWDQERWALPVGAPFSWGGQCRCHDGHEYRGITDTRIEFARIPPARVRAAVALMGTGPAGEYLRRHYRGAP